MRWGIFGPKQQSGTGPPRGDDDGPSVGNCAAMSPGLACARRRVRQAGMAEENFLIRYAGIQGRDDAATKAMFRFKDEVEQQSKGRIKVQVYYQTQLAGGNTIDQLRFLKIGALEMNNVGFAQMSQEAADFGAVTMPFLFTDSKAAASALGENSKARAILSANADNDGMKVLGFHFLGLRNLLMAKKPV